MEYVRLTWTIRRRPGPTSRLRAKHRERLGNRVNWAGDQQGERVAATLVLSSRNREAVVFGGCNGVERLIENAVIEVHDEAGKLGLEAGDDFPVHRWDA